MAESFKDSTEVCFEFSPQEPPENSTGEFQEDLQENRRRTLLLNPRMFFFRRVSTEESPEDTTGEFTRGL